MREENLLNIPELNESTGLTHEKVFVFIDDHKKKKKRVSPNGTWKVAYSDFLTSLMAFFLLLWLLSIQPGGKGVAVAEYFNNHNVLKNNKAVTDPGPSNSTSTYVAGEKVFVAHSENAGDKIFVSEAGKTGNEKQNNQTGTAAAPGTENEKTINGIRAAIEQNMAGIKDQVLVDMFDGKIRIQLVDSSGSEMFPVGSPTLTSRAKDVLKIVSSNIKPLKGDIVIEGHTDAAPFKGSINTNWELSTARASSARRILEETGIDSSRISRVIGFADKALIFPEPRDPRNRRISILVRP